MVRRFAAADVVEERRLAVEIRLALYEQPIAPSILAPLLAAWRNARKTSEGQKVECSRLEVAQLFIYALI